MHGKDNTFHSLPIATGCVDTDALVKSFIWSKTDDFSPEQLANLSLAAFGLERNGMRALEAYSNAYRFLVENKILSKTNGVQGHA